MSGESWKEFSLQHKYAEIPEEPRYIKKKKKKTVKKSTHKHQYADCMFDYGTTRADGTPWYTAGRYCVICGRIGDIHIGGNLRPMKDKPIFKVGFLDKYVKLEGTSES